MSVPPAALKPNPWNSNYVSPENEEKLRESMRRFGCYKPIVCRELEDGTLEILGGEHRARAAEALGLATVPVRNLGRVSDEMAKAIGLADNGRYGDDDMTRLADIVKAIGGGEEASLFLPFSEKDLATLFVVQDMDFDDLEMPGEDDRAELPSLAEKPTLTHTLMRFKVPLADAGAVQDLLDRVIKANGYAKDQDSLAAAGMALVDVARAARGAF